MVNKIGQFLGVNEMRNYKKLFKQLFSEFLGTFLYLSLVLSSGIAYGTNKANVVIALANGLVVASIVQVFGHVSGSHINPAVTVGALVCGHIKPLKAVCYVIMHVLGSISGAGVAYAVSADTIKSDLGATVPYKYTTADQVFALEFLSTFLLVALVLSVVDCNRGARGLGSSPLAVGLCISGCLCSTLPYSGSMNPVRTLGPAVVMGIYGYHWVYWVAPLLGGLVAGIVYKLVLGAGVAYAVSADTIKSDLGATVPYKYTTADQVFALEFLSTFLLVALVLSVVDCNRGARGLGSSPLAVGLCISGCLCSTLPYSGSMNPVRTLGPAVVMGIYGYHWVYWVAPLLGGLVAGIVYKLVLGAKNTEFYLEEEI